MKRVRIHVRLVEGRGGYRGEKIVGSREAHGWNIGIGLVVFGRAIKRGHTHLK